MVSFGSSLLIVNAKLGLMSTSSVCLVVVGYLVSSHRKMLVRTRSASVVQLLIGSVQSDYQQSNTGALKVPSRQEAYQMPSTGGLTEKRQNYPGYAKHERDEFILWCLFRCWFPWKWMFFKRRFLHFLFTPTYR